ncbi:MAG: hypothetical protein HQ518_07585 [Rhodopirellula sp.]|nr:hypothetical protein [Rhodopirellula sp.]
MFITTADAITMLPQWQYTLMVARRTHTATAITKQPIVIPQDIGRLTKTVLKTDRHFPVNVRFAI